MLRSLIVCTLLLSLTRGLFADTDPRREAFLAGQIRILLSHHHFARKDHPFDDRLSKQAFDNFLKRLDPQKRYLLAEDIDRLDDFELFIDDEMKMGRLRLYHVAEEIFLKRLKECSELVAELLTEEFDFKADEKFETDAEKKAFPKDKAERKDRWRRFLKYQCVSNYLDKLDELEDKYKKQEEDSLKDTKVDIPAPSTLPGYISTTSDAGIKATTPVVWPPDEKWIAETREKFRKDVAKDYRVYFERQLKLSKEDFFAKFLNSVTTIFDPHTTYMTPEIKEDFDISMSKSLEGIGAQLQETDDGYVRIESIVPGSASYRQGELKAGDVIIKVAQGKSGDEEIEIHNMPVREVVKYIRGPKGTTVRLTVRRGKKTLVIPIERDVVKLESAVARSTLYVDPESGKKIGYLNLPSFYWDFRNPKGRKCTEDVQNEIIKLQAKGMDALVFNLRGNGGGALEGARSIAGLFFDRGPVVQIKNLDGSLRILQDDDRHTLFSGPLLLLVDQFSASASEIFAAAMQDYGRGIVVGTGSTHGKGTVQNVVDLDAYVSSRDADLKPLGNLKITIQKFYRVNGESTQFKGVVPDIVLPGYRAYIESNERYLDHALPWDKIKEVEYRKWDKHSFPLEKLTNASLSRTQKYKVFQSIEEHERYLKARSENSRISLNIDEMLTLRKQDIEETERYNKVLEEAFPKDEISEDDEDEEKNEDGDKKEDRKLTDDEIHEKRDREEQEQLLHSIKRDPYFLESVNILGDFWRMKSLTSVERD